MSGPIVRNKTFFMGNYEGLRTRRATTLYLSVPTQQQREGNFSGGPQIFDPLTYDSATGRRSRFPETYSYEPFRPNRPIILKVLSDAECPWIGGIQLYRQRFGDERWRPVSWANRSPDQIERPDFRALFGKQRQCGELQQGCR